MTTYQVNPDPSHDRFDRFDAAARGGAAATLAAVAAVLGTMALDANGTLVAWLVVAGAALPAGLAPIGRWHWTSRRPDHRAPRPLGADERSVLVAAEAAVARLAAAAHGAAPGPVADHLALLHQRGRHRLVPLRRTLDTAAALAVDARHALLAEAAGTVRQLHRLATSAEMLRTAQAAHGPEDELAGLTDATDAITAALAAVPHTTPTR